jgi:hypothetical protein
MQILIRSLLCTRDLIHACLLLKTGSLAWVHDQIRPAGSNPIRTGIPPPQKKKKTEKRRIWGRAGCLLGKILKKIQNPFKKIWFSRVFFFINNGLYFYIIKV